MKQKPIEKPVLPTNYYDENGGLTKEALLYEFRRHKWVCEQDIKLPVNFYNENDELTKEGIHFTLRCRELHENLNLETPFVFYGDDDLGRIKVITDDGRIYLILEEIEEKEKNKPFMWIKFLDITNDELNASQILITTP